MQISWFLTVFTIHCYKNIQWVSSLFLKQEVDSMDVMFKSSFIQEKTWIKTLGFQNLSGPLQPTVVIFEKRSINIFFFLPDPSVIQKWGWMRFVEEWIIHSSLSFAWKPTASENPFINILQVENAQIVQQSWHGHCSEYPLCSITIYQK